MYNPQHACIQSERSPPFRWWRCVHGPGEQDRMKSPQSRGSWMAGFWSVCSQPRTDPEKPSRAVGEPTSNEVTHLVLSPASGQQQSEPTPVKSRAFTGFAHTHFLFGVSKDKASVWCVKPREPFLVEATIRQTFESDLVALLWDPVGPWCL